MTWLRRKGNIWDYLVHCVNQALLRKGGGVGMAPAQAVCVSKHGLKCKETSLLLASHLPQKEDVCIHMFTLNPALLQEDTA